MNKQFLKDSFGWGLALWLIGYALGLVLFAFVPLSSIGWIITPIGTTATLGILLRKIKLNSLRYFMGLAAIWTLLAVVFDYLFIVKVFKPADGYYKLDVYLYYSLIILLPLAIGWWKKPRAQNVSADLDSDSIPPICQH